MRRTVLALTAATLASSFASCAPMAPVVVAPGTNTPSPAPPETRRFLRVAFGRVVIGIDPLTVDEAKSRWHRVVFFEGDRAVRVDYVSPSDARSGITQIAYEPDGTQRLKNVDAYGVEAYEETLTPDGVRSRVYRSGAANDMGCASVRERYDGSGHVVGSRCFDADGRSVIDAEGCHEHRFDYDARGRKQREACFAVDGAATTFREGGHAVVTEYDARGYASLSARQRADGAPALDTAGCASVRTDHDAAGNVTLETCLDAGGRPHGMNGSDAVSTRWAHDSSGCSTSAESLDARGAPINVLGVARTVYTRDAACGPLSVLLLDARGERAAVERKATYIEYTRSAEGLVVEQRCAGARSEPVCCFDAVGADGALVRTAYDGRGRETQRRGFTASNAPSKVRTTYPHEWRMVYSPDGISRQVSYFDENGHPAMANGTVARHAFTFDRLGSLESVQSFGPGGEPVRPSTGCSAMHRTYDTAHRLSSIECRGTDGELAAASLMLEGISWPSGAARVVIERGGSTVENVYQDAAGTVVKRVTCGATRCYL